MSSEPTSPLFLPDPAPPYSPPGLDIIAPEPARHLGFVPFPEYKAYFRLDAAAHTLWYYPMTSNGHMRVVLTPEGQPYPIQVTWGTDPTGQMAAILQTLRRLSSAD